MIRRLFKKNTQNLSCGEVLELLQGYLDGEVTAEQARKVAGHLESCKPCDNELLVYKKIKGCLKATRPEVDPGVLQSLEAFSGKLVLGEIE